MTRTKFERHDKIAFLISICALAVAIVSGTVVMTFGKLNRSNATLPIRPTSEITVVKTIAPTTAPTLTPASLRAPSDVTPRWQNVPTLPAQTPLALPPNHPSVDVATCESCHGSFRKMGK